MYKVFVSTVKSPDIVSALSVPTLVIFVCAAVDKVPASVVAVRVPVTVTPPLAVASFAALS